MEKRRAAIDAGSVREINSNVGLIGGRPCCRRGTGQGRQSQEKLRR